MIDPISKDILDEGQKAMAEGSEIELPSIYSAKDIEITVWNRVLYRIAKLGREGMTVNDEDRSRIWQEEVQKIATQIQEKDLKNRGGNARILPPGEVKIPLVSSIGAFEGLLYVG